MDTGIAKTKTEAQFHLIPLCMTSSKKENMETGHFKVVDRYHRGIESAYISRDERSSYPLEK